MTLLELSVEYRDHARALDFRIVQLRDAWEHTMDEGERCMLAERIRVLSTMLREARELAVLCERYYDRGYRRNVKYTIYADNSAELSRLKRNLIRALKEDVTPRQREVLTLYYAQGLNMREIGERLGVDKSTVSRNIKRGERRLQRCLRYGAEAFLRNLYD